MGRGIGEGWGRIGVGRGRLGVGLGRAVCEVQNFLT